MFWQYWWLSYLRFWKIFNNLFRPVGLLQVVGGMSIYMIAFINKTRLSENIFQDANNTDSCIMGALFCNLKIMANHCVS